MTGLSLTSFLFMALPCSLSVLFIRLRSPTLDLRAVVDAHDADDARGQLLCHHESSHRLVHLRRDLGRHGAVQAVARQDRGEVLHVRRPRGGGAGMVV